MSQRRGSVLLLSYLFIAFLSTWAAAGFRQTVTDLNSSERYVDTLQAFHNAEAGLDRALDWMRQQPTPPSGIISFDPFTTPATSNCSVNNPTQPARPSQPLLGGAFLVCIGPDANNPTSYLDLFTVTVTGQSAGAQVSRQVTETVQTQSFSRYSYFTNSERLPTGTPIWFTTRDQLTGPVHSNDQLNISGSPVFNGGVTSSAGSINYKNPPPTGGNNPQFNGGLTLGVPAVTMPNSAVKLRTAAASGGQWYVGNTTIVLQSDGTMRVTNPASGLVSQPVPLPANGAIFVNGGDVTVSGVLDGKVTIGTSANIIVNSSIFYVDNPQTNPQSNDVLGLVAENNVVVSQSAPYDVTIQASIMALDNPLTATPLDGSFTVQNWSVGPPKGTLAVYGGIVQGARGPVGTFSSSSGNKLSGYSKDYRYDTRFSGTAPPFFPTTGAFEQMVWQENN